MKRAGRWHAARAVIAWAVLLAASTAPAAPSQGDGGLVARVNEQFGLVRSRVFQVDVHAGDRVTVAVLEIDGLPDALFLTPHSVRSNAYEVLVQRADGRLVPVAPSPVSTMRGELLAHPGSRVAASLLDDGLYARILLATGRELWLEPVGSRVRGAPAGSHVLYDGADVLGCGGTCGTDALVDAMAHRDTASGDRGQGGQRDGLHTAELACDADYEYFLAQGGSVEKVELRINQLINAMNVQYETDVGITHTITSILVRTAPSQPYTSTDALMLLNQFREQWDNHHGDIPRDLAQLFTGKDLDGQTIGLAWTGVVCNIHWAYSLVQSDFSSGFSCVTDLSAHEIGHNWSANHCPCPYTMNPAISCVNAFHPSETIPEILAFRDSRTCLDVDDPLGGCCVGTACSVETEIDCLALGGIYVGDDTDCAGDPCAEPTGACCAGTACSVETEPDCVALGGSYVGDDTDCAGNPCAPPTGACCAGTACSVETEPDCVALGGSYLGDGTDCTSDLCHYGVTNPATADFDTGAGKILTGTFLDTHAQDDVPEVLRETRTASSPSRRISRLSHTWTFDVVAGEAYSFSIDAHHQRNDEGDDFSFSYSLDNVDFTDMLVVAKTEDDDLLQTYDFIEDIAGTVYVQVRDLDRTPGHGVRHTVSVDEMFISSTWEGHDVNPPPAPTGLVATPGDAVVLLDWDDSPVADLMGYIIFRSLISGGPCAPLTGLLPTSDYADSDVTNGKTYYYFLTAVDQAGNQSYLSDPVSATPQPPGAAAKRPAGSRGPRVRPRGLR